MRVLIVDDEPAARAKLRRLLAAEVDVAELLEAPDAPAALALVRGLRAPPDLALLDIEMPGGHGVQLAAALREAGVRCIVFSTAHAEHALQAFELAALDYLLKPYTAERLGAALAIGAPLMLAVSAGFGLAAFGPYARAQARVGPAAQ